MLAVCCYRNRGWHHQPSGGKAHHWLTLTVPKFWNFDEKLVIEFHQNVLSCHISSFQSSWHILNLQSWSCLITDHQVDQNFSYTHEGGRFSVGSCFLKCAKSLWRIFALPVGWMSVTLNTALQSFPTLCPLAEQRHVPLYKWTFESLTTRAVCIAKSRRCGHLTKVITLWCGKYVHKLNIGHWELPLHILTTEILN